MPLIWLDPIADPNTYGVGDLEFGLQMLAYNGERSMFFIALNASVPTGDDKRDLGSGDTVLEPTTLWLYDFGGGSYLQNRIGFEIPVDTDVAENTLNYDIGIYHTCLSTEEWPVFRFWTAIAEVNGSSVMNSADAGQNFVDLTLGMRWLVREADEVGIGWSFPVSASEAFDQQLWMSYRLHF